MQGPIPPAPAPHTLRSVSCQTDEDPLFSSMQAGCLGPLPVPILLPKCVPTLHTRIRTHAYTHCVPLHTSPARHHSPSLDLALTLDPHLTWCPVSHPWDISCPLAFLWGSLCLPCPATCWSCPRLC